MNIFNSVKTLFGSKTTEKLSKEVEALKTQVDLQKLLLEDSGTAIPTTFPSSSANKEKAIEDDSAGKLKRVPVRKLQYLYITNQFVFRGVNIRADEIVSRGYKVVGDDDEGVKECENLIERSGGGLLFRGLSINCDVSGDAYVEKVYNDSHNQLVKLKHINPVTFGFLTDISGNIVLDDNKEPASYMQVYTDEQGVEQKVEVEKKRISHLMFNTFCDEFNGISTLQPVYNTALRLMNMENSAAEAAVKTANPLFVGTTETKSLKDLANWNKVLGNISGKEQVFLPQGVTLSMLSPGMQNFSKYSDYFLDAVVCSLGVPKSILTGTGDASGGNRATASIQSRHFYSIVRANQIIVEKMFNDIFKEYAEVAGFKAPTLVFEDIAEDADMSGQRAIELYQSGVITITEARDMIGLDSTEAKIKELLPKKEIKEVNPTAVVDMDIKKQDMKTWHKDTIQPQKGDKKTQHINPDAPSV